MLISNMRTQHILTVMLRMSEGSIMICLGAKSFCNHFPDVKQHKQRKKQRAKEMSYRL